MQTPDGIALIPANYQEVVALLKSDDLSAVEIPIASQCRQKILYSVESVTTTWTQAEISVCGLTVDQIATYLNSNKVSLITFGVRFLGEQKSASDKQEPDSESETMGYGNGFGITIAIYHHFIANRTAPELREFLKNRRIPQQAKFAKQLAGIYAETNQCGE